MWHFEFQAPVGSRILRKWFIGITHFGDYKQWFDLENREWVDGPGSQPAGITTLCSCNSFKAFKRHLRKHPELQEIDGDVILVSRFVGYSIIARWVPQ